MRMETKEMNFKGFKMNGFLALFLFLFVWAGATVWCFVTGGVLLYVLGAVMSVLWIILNCGYMMLEPNEARVMMFFGKYRGTYKTVGYHWINPFVNTKSFAL